VISVRSAQPGDGAALVETTRALAQFHGYDESFKAGAEDFERALFCEHPVIGALIAECDGKVAGSVVWHRSFSTNAGQEIMYLEDILVLPDFRRMGVAKALMQATARVALSRGHDAMFWMAKDWNEGALSFYRDCGADIEPDFQVCRVKGAALKALAL
jgi:GNAT superfamily N-acetyltransferase